MKKIIFQTNIDAYQTNCFPANLTYVPRKGEMVAVVAVFKSYFAEKKLPLRLEVTQVTYFDNDVVVCDLWYNDTDKKIADLAGAKTL